MQFIWLGVAWQPQGIATTFPVSIELRQSTNGLLLSR